MIYNNNFIEPIEQSIPLKVICINPKTSIKLIKGGIYNALAYHKYNGSHTLHIENMGNYSTENFKIIDGRSFADIPEFRVNKKTLQTDVDYKGQYIKCNYGGTKNLKEGEYYYVENDVKEQRNLYNGSVYYEKKLKIRGIRNVVTKYRFQEVPLPEQRKIKLNNLKGNKVKTGEKTRKFLLYDEKEKIKILIDMLTRVLNDINNIELVKGHKLNLIDLIIKRGKNYNIIKEDVEHFYKHIRPLLKPYENIIK